MIVTKILKPENWLLVTGHLEAINYQLSTINYQLISRLDWYKFDPDPKFLGLK